MYQHEEKSGTVDSFRSGIRVFDGRLQFVGQGCQDLVELSVSQSLVLCRPPAAPEEPQLEVR